MPDLVTRLPEAWAGLSGAAAWTGILSAVLLAFFAFIGFEGLANIAEEVKEPARTLPRAIFLTLILVTLLYVIVVWVALVAVPREELAATRRALEPGVRARDRRLARRHHRHLHRGDHQRRHRVHGDGLARALRHGRARPAAGAARRASMRARARRCKPPRSSSRSTLVLAVAFPIEGLAETTARLSLVIFAFVNAALIKLKMDRVRRAGRRLRRARLGAGGGARDQPRPAR